MSDILDRTQSCIEEPITLPVQDAAYIAEVLLMTVAESMDRVAVRALDERDTLDESEVLLIEVEMPAAVRKLLEQHVEDLACDKGNRVVASSCGGGGGFTLNDMVSLGVNIGDGTVRVKIRDTEEVHIRANAQILPE